MLGSLLEKDITTPEYYPLTVNALVNACNQKSNRDPMVGYGEEIVNRALESLRAKGLAGIVTGGSNRVPKHAHRLSDRLNLGRREMALMCELMVRGPQTTGELRGRASRMYEFSDLEEVESCLRGLMDREPDPLVTRLPHTAGTKDNRYAHLLGGEPDISPEAAPPAGRVERNSDDEIAGLRASVAELRAEMDDLKLQLEQFRRQFE